MLQGKINRILLAKLPVLLAGITILSAGVSCAGVIPAETPADITTTSENHVKPTSTNNNDAWHLNEWIINDYSIFPANPKTGEETTVWTTIYSGNSDSSFIKAFLIVNGEIVDEQQLEVPIDEAFPFVFVYSPEDPGEYEICVHVVCESKTESTKPFETDAFFVDAYQTVTVTG